MKIKLLIWGDNFTLGDLRQCEVWAATTVGLGYKYEVSCILFIHLGLGTDEIAVIHLFNQAYLQQMKEVAIWSVWGNITDRSDLLDWTFQTVRFNSCALLVYLPLNPHEADGDLVYWSSVNTYLPPLCLELSSYSVRFFDPLLCGVLSSAWRTPDRNSMRRNERVSWELKFISNAGAVVCVLLYVSCHCHKQVLSFFKKKRKKKRKENHQDQSTSFIWDWPFSDFFPPCVLVWMSCFRRSTACNWQAVKPVWCFKSL